MLFALVKEIRVMKRISIVFILLAAAFSAAAFERDFMNQPTKKKVDLNRRDKYPAGFNLYALGPVGLGGVSFDYFIVPKISLELGAGARNFNPDLGFFVGGKYHFFGNSFLNTTPYIGVFSGFEYTGDDLRNYNLYVPFGIQHIKKNHLAWSLEVAYKRDVYDPERSFYGGAKIGYRF